MYTIKNNSKYELIIKNSRFITVLEKVNDVDDVKNILDSLKIEYPDATHYCYGYIIGDLKKASDDGEPGGTAGIPILKVLESNELTNILCVVIRYFGGIKLGANGLVRAYTKGVSNAIKENELCELVDGLNILITFPYGDIKEIDYLLRDCKINDKKFDNLVTYNLDISLDFIEIIKSKNIDYKIIKEIKIEK